MKDKIFELVAKGYEVNFRASHILPRGVDITLRKKNRQSNVTVDRVMGPDNEMLLFTLDKLEKTFDDRSEHKTFDNTQITLVRMVYPKNEYLERYFEAHKIAYKVRHDPSDYVNRFTLVYECELTNWEFGELQTFLDIIK